ncbi:protein-methionine-sulfoxide reductase catalytic subunit MsrP [Dichotomicrobium thermohalophilum]|uniref:Protein-methionine-sulfoxide reductase catalytic subunit MsrP n=1 Tax=Dichotomicrobium thermohalophilum TaxID=933063 RepID=A0A397Q6W3_9HYPH|nr:protein-methionine-sulfoxide reductase catalytic subunit MsrP [Dichotomicrobium thermohalophilum]RIA56703.1 sulfoxide reductase catalytic subunit YedY [Dichotomicrobium thermohalophilum]
MRIIRKKGWELPERLVTDETVFLNRRRFMQGAGAVAGAGLVGGGLGAGLSDMAMAAQDPSAGLYPVPRNPEYKVSRPITPEETATTYNNFYEFGSHKRISSAAQALPIRPWEIAIQGEVEKPFKIGIDELLKKMPLEERVYRLRCVEAWSMVIPWSGFPMKALLDLAKPLGKAKYVKMQTFMNADVARGQRQHWYPWPYTEGLTIKEAAHDLTFMVTGMYGKPVPRQNGAPLRLAVPWKYGFKSVKSIVLFEFTDQRPTTFWEEIAPSEYGFWANVNPDVPHPRWSQETEEVIGTDKRIPTQIYNGYGDYVADLYKGMEGERLFM